MPEEKAYDTIALLNKKRTVYPTIPPFVPKEGNTFLGIVPVREGSKGCRGKNMKLLGGKPLYRWVADAARNSGIFSKIVVMSDWDDLCNDAQRNGYEVLHEPKMLAEDWAYVGQAMAWAVEQPTLAAFSHVQLLQATSPFLTPRHLQEAAALMQDRGADMIVGITPSQDPTAFTKTVPPNWSLKEWYPEEFRSKRRQEFPQTWGLNGYIYLARREIWAKQRDWWKTNIIGYPMSAEDHIDINTEEDFEYAEYCLTRLARSLSSKRSLWTSLRRLLICD